MPRPKRTGGTQSTEWPIKLNSFFSQHPRLTKKGVALILNDIAQANGYKSISAYALYKYCNVNEERRPTERFIACWRLFEQQLQQLRNADLAVRMSNGKHILTIVDGQPETVWLPNGVFLRRCNQCRVSFIGQWNAKRCIACR